jgi:hypothetical protein
MKYLAAVAGFRFDPAEVLFSASDGRLWFGLHFHSVQIAPNSIVLKHAGQQTERVK